MIASLPLRTLLLTAAAFTAAGQAPREAAGARAETFLARKQFAAALAEAEVIHRTAPDDLTGYQLMAAAQIELGDYDEAEQQLQWMLDLRIGKSDSRGWILLARWREATGDLEGALDAVNQSFTRLAPGQDREREMVTAYAARLLCLAGKTALAEQTIVRYATAANAAPDTLETLARLRLAQDRRSEAIDALRRLVAAAPDPRHLYLLAEATHSASDYAVFEQAARAVTANPDNANRELARYYAGPGKQPAKALEVARRESELRHDIFTLDALAVALFANQKTAEAREVMQRVLAVGTRHPEILADAARLGIKTQ
jgi:tetratricopeptide (TPR) repeat protein